MMERAAIEAMIRATYDARVRGDGAAMAAHCLPDAIYRVSGDSGASPVACRHSGPALRNALEGLNAAMPVRELRIVSLVIDGDRAAAEIEARLVFAPTGEEFETHWCNTFVFRDGKVAEVVEYIDTARAAQLMASAVRRPD